VRNTTVVNVDGINYRLKYSRNPITRREGKGVLIVKKMNGFPINSSVVYDEVIAAFVEITRRNLESKKQP